jgi:putative Mn2+ efflux pump MntP
VVALLLLAVALGLSNLAASVGFGVSGAGSPGAPGSPGAGRAGGAVRVRIAVVFGLFEAGMPVLGLLLGHGLADSLGQAARWLGGGVLLVFGTAGLARGWRGPGGGGGAVEGLESRRIGRLLLGGLVLSGDNLAAGFALGSYHVALALAAVVFGLVSVAMSLAGLELGARIGAAAGERSELVACALLIVAGAVIAAGAL